MSNSHSQVALLRAIERQTEKNTKTPKTAKDALIRMGILTKCGKVTAHYAAEPRMRKPMLAKSA
ncbi:hypothetical protein K2X14_13935 [Acetobacter sp. TBRC 12305]|uniref:Uncharacterized protein n=1 Tax=Acetobacter garciniae TaxID=2817435 RepID=A0A939HLS7_9PROT|nr:hypothetical protein [Acetobacter garciniae]MBO1326818.1 hypothetical protein [Acetobacter garciniae]MBX0345934.1 hypothetical protein [Acetobacter garciniae]